MREVQRPEWGAFERRGFLQAPAAGAPSPIVVWPGKESGEDFWSADAYIMKTPNFFRIRSKIKELCPSEEDRLHSEPLSIPVAGKSGSVAQNTPFVGLRRKGSCFILKL